jgi:hypothetical protein
MSAPPGHGLVLAGFAGFLLLQPVADGLLPVEHLAADADAGRPDPPGLPALQRVHRQGQLPGQFRPVKPAIQERRIGARILQGIGIHDFLLAPPPRGSGLVIG